MKRILRTSLFWKTYTMALAGTLPLVAMSQQTEEVAGPGVLSPAWIDLYQTELLLGAVGVMLFFVLLALFALYGVLRTMLHEVMAQQGADAPEFESGWSRFMKRMTQAVPIENEHEIMKHEYDGIIELDNKLPPWWVAMFYVTIIFGVGYLWYYEVMDGPGSADEYAMEMKQAEAEVAAYLASMEDLVDETNVTVLVDDTRLAAGKELFEKNCVACHGPQGQGLIGLGPNLTDQYWLHGGDVKSMFTTVKYGVKATSMIAWGKQLTPTQLHNVVSYVYSLEGSNPPNAKEAEGDLFERNPEDDYGEEAVPETESDDAVALAMPNAQ